MSASDRAKDPLVNLGKGGQGTGRLPRMFDLSALLLIRGLRNMAIGFHSWGKVNRVTLNNVFEVLASGVTSFQSKLEIALGELCPCGTLIPCK